MGRPLRVIVPGVAVHIIQRGNNREPCFRRETDYLVYLSGLRGLSQRHGCAIHAYCLMTNHVHLLVTPATESGCTDLMRDLGQRYVPYFNRAHRRTGTLWEGRFRSCLVESSEYVLACYRYIECNPVRAAMVERPADYPWSSVRANLGLALDPSLREHAEFEALGGHPESRRVAYGKLFDMPLDRSMLDGIREATNSGYPLAGETFKHAVVAPLGGRVERRRPGPRPGVERNCRPDPELRLES